MSLEKKKKETTENKKKNERKKDVMEKTEVEIARLERERVGKKEKGRV